jgi:hypothetical protein
MIHLSRTNGGLMSNLYWLSEAQMERLRAYLPKSNGAPTTTQRSKVVPVFRIDWGRPLCDTR